ncbi:hypothetical protein GXW78_00390 [Roseomonas terrae]|uniref:Uncharacterized protein n=1 Tax=Neoroseomonas terrae TaxID=424799 RepID=A0ABS5EAP9_9PROT|nr:hypothetical protein [Neoroseomonas terrae]MBR0648104.1 hypothetical protein [Neoroseomonas terrae]
MASTQPTYAAAFEASRGAPQMIDTHSVVDVSGEYFAAVTPALELALASAHEAGHERAVRILHAVIAILDDPGLR